MSELEAALDLLRRTDPHSLSKHLESVSRLAPDIAEDLLSLVDVPLAVGEDPQNGKKYLKCDYNRDGDSYRSPWSNQFYPEQDEESPLPSRKLRELEIIANNSFDVYRDLYYEGGVSSVYFWDVDEDDEGSTGDFAGVVLLKKGTQRENSMWDSIHVLEVNHTASGSAAYKITSTVILHLNEGELQLAGNLVRQTEKTMAVADYNSHIVNIGTLIEDVEYKLRNQLQEVYFGKTKDISTELRSLGSLEAAGANQSKHSDLVSSLQKVSV